jgi:integrase
VSTDPTSRTIHLSLADVLAAVRTASLPERRRQEMASALRTIGRVLDRPLERIPAIPRLLAIRLSDVAPRAAGISQARWNNVRALARAAIALVRPVSPGRQLNELSPAWKLLVDHLGRGIRASLSRFLRFCSAHGIGPENVCQETFDQFRLFLSEALLPDLEKALIRTKRAWRAAQELESWPRLTVEVPDRSKKWTLTWESFPASLREDFNRWRDRLAGRDMLDEMPVRAVRGTTLRMREWQVRAFASALVLRGRNPATILSLADLLEIEAFKEGLRYWLERNGNKQTPATGGIAACLMAIARHHVRLDRPQLDRLATIARRLTPDQRGLTESNRARLRQFDDAGNVHSLLTLPATLMRLAVRNPDRRRTAVQAQVAVAVEILLMAPIRLGNLAQLDLERNLIRPGRGNAVHIVVEAENVKNREPLEYPLPAQSVRLLQTYIDDFRPSLVPASSSALFPGRIGGPRNPQSFGQQLSKAIRDHTGLRINPHLFRHIAAKLFLDQNPGAYEVMRRVLAQRSISTTTSFYTGAETAAAVRHFDETILKLRGDGRPPASKP